MAHVTSIRLYGNGRVFIGTHHVFFVLTMNDGTYVLLELTNNNGSSSSSSSGLFTKILIRQRKASSLNDVLEKRSDTNTPAEKWGSTEETRTKPWADIQLYVPGVKDCRTFADAIHRDCGVNKRCDD